MAELKIKADSGGGTVSFKGPATTTSNAAVQLTLPVDDGTANQYLKTDGSGALSWATVASVGGGTGVDFNDSVKTRWGTDNDLEMYHDNSNSYIKHANNGSLEIDATSSGHIILKPDGEVKVGNAKNLKIDDGNLVIGTAGHGIDFSAQTATSATDSTTSHELLDHYEEGTWTPVPKISHVTTGITASVAGAYTKIGRLVHISFKVAFSDKGSNGGQFTVHGLPFAEDGTYIAGSSTGGGGFCFYQTGLAGLTVDGNMTFRAESSMLYMQVLNGDNLTVIPAGSELADDTTIFGHGTYYA